MICQSKSTHVISKGLYSSEEINILSDHINISNKISVLTIHQNILNHNFFNKNFTSSFFMGCTFRGMHLGHIFLMGLARQFSFNVPPPSQNRGNPHTSNGLSVAVFRVKSEKKNISLVTTRWDRPNKTIKKGDFTSLVLCCTSTSIQVL